MNILTGQRIGNYHQFLDDLSHHITRLDIQGLLKPTVTIAAAYSGINIRSCTPCPGLKPGLIEYGTCAYRVIE